MFGSNKNKDTEGAAVETIIGKNTSFKGVANVQGSIRIDGQFEGEVSSQATVVIGATGVVTAKISARNLTIAGEVTGDVEVGEKLELLSTAKLFGDIQISVLTIEEGAVFKGASEMKKSVIQATPATPIASSAAATKKA